MPQYFHLLLLSSLLLDLTEQRECEIKTRVCNWALDVTPSTAELCAAAGHDVQRSVRLQTDRHTQNAPCYAPHDGGEAQLSLSPTEEVAVPSILRTQEPQDARKLPDGAEHQLH